MIAVKNLQYLNELMIQEELLRAIAMLYTDMVSNAQLRTMLNEIIKTSTKNSEELLAYVKSHKA